MYKENKFLTFSDARNFVVKLGLKSSKEWYAFCKSGKKPSIIPSAAYKVYSNEWRGWSYWLGTEFLSYKDASKFISQFNFKNVNDWRNYCQSGLKPCNIPSNPNVCYKKWKDWPSFLGYKYNRRKYAVNENYFTKWSSDMAYILGLWWADGYIDKWKFCITLHDKDSYLLLEILNRMGSNCPLVRHSENSMKIVICSKKIVTDIIKLGGEFRKSLSIGFPFVPDKYLPDFIRGLWDGDGCVYYDKGNKYYKSNIISGSRVFIEDLIKLLRKKCNVNGYFRVKKQCAGSIIVDRCLSKDSTSYSFNLGCNDSKRLRNYIYYDGCVLMLKRKYEKFKIAGDIRLPYKSINRLSLGELHKFVCKLNFSKRSDWFQYWKENDRPLNIPFDPYIYYRKKGWRGWKRFLNR